MPGHEIKTNPELLAALECAKDRYARLSEEEQEACFEEQKRRWVKAEAAWNEDATVICR